MSDIGDGFTSTGCATELHAVCGAPGLCACGCHQPAQPAGERLEGGLGSPSDPPAVPEASEGAEQDRVLRIYVDVPEAADEDTRHAIFNAVADAAFAAQPEQRDWDVLTYTRGVVEE